ncbi:MAG TPA: hypothetical protein VGK29_03135 [Paludibaculum sp.]|jgi:hypothetical protein
MTTGDHHNAFDEMDNHGGEAYCIYVTARVEGEGQDAMMLLELPMRQVQSAPRGKGQRKSHGFTLVADFERPNGGRYQLRGWLSITKR